MHKKTVRLFHFLRSCDICWGCFVLALVLSISAPHAIAQVPPADSSLSQVSEPSGDSPAPPGQTQAIQNDPLAWLGNSLTCEELTDQIKARYAPLGKFSELPAEKKVELRQVLDITCSARFAACHFANCEKLKTPQTTDANQSVNSGKEFAEDAEKNAKLEAEQKRLAEESAQTAEKARKELDSLYANYLQLREKKIASLKKSELTKGSTWERIHMSEEEQQKFERKAEASGEGESAPEQGNSPLDRAISKYSDKTPTSHAPLYSDRSNSSNPNGSKRRAKKGEDSAPDEGVVDYQSLDPDSPIVRRKVQTPPPASRGF